MFWRRRFKDNTGSIDLKRGIRIWNSFSSETIENGC